MHTNLALLLKETKQPRKPLMSLLITPTMPAFGQQSKPAGAKAVQFGHAPKELVNSLGGATKLLYNITAPIHSSRGMQMMVMDLGGFTLLRSLMDLKRQFIYKNTVDNKRENNFAAARERVLMETMGSLPDFIGVLAAWTLMGLEKSKKAFGKRFVDMDTLGKFEALLKSNKANTAEGFIEKLAHYIDADHASKLTPLMKKALLGKDCVSTTAAEMALKLGLDSLDKPHTAGALTLDTLLADAKTLIERATENAAKQNQSWNKAALTLTKSTLKRYGWLIPAGLGLGALYNFSAPYIIQKVTKKVDGVDDYVGEAGLRTLNKTGDNHQGKKRGLLPYLRESLSQGNYLPLLISLVPIPVMLGCVDTEKLASEGIKAAFNNPFKKGFFKKALNMMQYSRVAPYAGPQQMAALYALVVFSRVAAARNAIEFRERTVDAFLGWTIWVVAEPVLKRLFSQIADEKMGTQLIKKVGDQQLVKTEAEIVKLIKNQAVRLKTLKANTWISAASMIATMGLLGIVEPYLSIKITEWQSKKVYGGQLNQFKGAQHKPA